MPLRGRCPRRGAGLCCALLLLALAAGARAHGGRQSLEQWGAFEPGPAQCQQTIGQAAAECGARTWAARSACLAAPLDGAVCDAAATARAVTAARLDALDQIDARCTERQAGDLSYLGLFDLQTDLIDFCRAWDDAAASAVFGPPGGSAPTDSAAVECVRQAARTTSQLMSFIFRIRRQAMDRMVGIAMPLASKTALLDLTAQRIARARSKLADRLAAACTSERFRAIYQRDAQAFLDGIGARADCLGAQFYIQDTFLCPAAVCGNFIVEPGETCDDGNRLDGDGCGGDCV